MTDPTREAQALYERGQHALETEDYHEAIEVFTRVIALRADVALGYRSRALAYLGLRDRVRALADYDQAIRLRPDDSILRAERAVEYLKQRNYTAACSDAETVLHQDPARADMLALRARCRAALGDSVGAEQDFAQALTLDPEHAPDYLTERARLKLECSLPAAVVEDTSTALRIMPTHIEALELRGMALEQLGDLAGAAEDYRAVVNVAPGEVSAWLRLGWIAFHTGDSGQAVQAAHRVLELRPDFAPAQELLGRASLELQDFPAALAAFDQLVQAIPHRAAGYLLRAAVHLAQRDFGAAEAELKQALAREPDSVPTLNQLAWFWATCADEGFRKPRLAVECATRACECTEWNDATCLDTLAAAYAACSEFPSAIAWQEKALILAPSEHAYRDRLTKYQANQSHLEP